MSRLTIEMPADLCDGDRGTTERDAATGSNDRYRAADLDGATRTFVRWVESWAGA